MSDAAWIALGGMVTTIVGFLTMWVKLRYGAKQTEEVKDKVDENTKITKAGAAAAVATAKTAANTAADAKTVAEDISKKLNGGIDSSISQAIAPLKKTLEEHAAFDEKNMSEIRSILADLTKKVDGR